MIFCVDQCNYELNTWNKYFLRSCLYILKQLISLDKDTHLIAIWGAEM